eukprot:g6421.t1
MANGSHQSPRVIRIWVHSDPGNIFHRQTITPLTDTDPLTATNSIGAVEFKCGLRPKFPQDAPFCDKAEVLLISPFTGGGDDTTLSYTLSKLPNLKWIHALSAGVDKFLPTLVRNLFTGAGAGRGSGMPITNARHAFSYSLAEYSLFAMLYFTKQADRLKRNQLAKSSWQDRFEMNTLQEKRLGFVGFGSIGFECYKMVRHLPWKRPVLIHRRTRGSSVIHGDADPDSGTKAANATAPTGIDFDDDYPGEGIGVGSGIFASPQYCSKEEVFANSDVLICTLPGTPETKHFCDAASIALIPDKAILLSLGRGSCIDEAALVQHADRFTGIALDVFEQEPLPEESPLWTLPNVLISPHNADMISTFMSDSWLVFGKRFKEYAAGMAFSDGMIDVQTGAKMSNLHNAITLFTVDPPGPPDTGAAPEQQDPFTRQKPEPPPQTPRTVTDGLAVPDCPQIGFDGKRKDEDILSPPAKELLQDERRQQAIYAEDCKQARRILAKFVRRKVLGPSSSGGLRRSGGANGAGMDVSMDMALQLGEVVGPEMSHNEAAGAGSSRPVSARRAKKRGLSARAETLSLEDALAEEGLEELGLKKVISTPTHFDQDFNVSFLDEDTTTIVTLQNQGLTPVTPSGGDRQRILAGRRGVDALANRGSATAMRGTFSAGYSAANASMMTILEGPAAAEQEVEASRLSGGVLEGGEEEHYEFETKKQERLRKYNQVVREISLTRLPQTRKFLAQLLLYEFVEAAGAAGDEVEAGEVEKEISAGALPNTGGSSTPPRPDLQEELQHALFKIGKAPIIFVGQKYVGGLEELEAAVKVDGPDSGGAGQATGRSGSKGGEKKDRISPRTPRIPAGKEGAPSKNTSRLEQLFDEQFFRGKPGVVSGNGKAGKKSKQEVEDADFNPMLDGDAKKFTSLKVKRARAWQAVDRFFERFKHKQFQPGGSGGGSDEAVERAVRVDDARMGRKKGKDNQEDGEGVKEPNHFDGDFDPFVLPYSGHLDFRRSTSDSSVGTEVPAGGGLSDAKPRARRRGLFGLCFRGKKKGGADDDDGHMINDLGGMAGDHSDAGSPRARAEADGDKNDKKSKQSNRLVPQRKVFRMKSNPKRQLDYDLVFPVKVAPVFSGLENEVLWNYSKLSRCLCELLERRGGYLANTLSTNPYVSHLTEAFSAATNLAASAVSPVTDPLLFFLVTYVAPSTAKYAKTSLTRFRTVQRCFRGATLVKLISRNVVPAVGCQQLLDEGVIYDVNLEEMILAKLLHERRQIFHATITEKKTTERRAKEKAKAEARALLYGSELKDEEDAATEVDKNARMKGENGGKAAEAPLHEKAERERGEGGDETERAALAHDLTEGADGKSEAADKITAAKPEAKKLQSAAGPSTPFAIQIQVAFERLFSDYLPFLAQKGQQFEKNRVYALQCHRGLNNAGINAKHSLVIKRATAYFTPKAVRQQQHATPLEKITTATLNFGGQVVPTITRELNPFAGRVFVLNTWIHRQPVGLSSEDEFRKIVAELQQQQDDHDQTTAPTTARSGGASSSLKSGKEGGQEDAEDESDFPPPEPPTSSAAAQAAVTTLRRAKTFFSKAFEKQVQPRSGAVNYDGVKNAPSSKEDYDVFRLAAYASFLINCYNLLRLHANVELGCPALYYSSSEITNASTKYSTSAYLRHPFGRSSGDFFRSVGYQFKHGRVLTLMDIWDRLVSSSSSSSALESALVGLAVQGQGGADTKGQLSNTGGQMTSAGGTVAAMGSSSQVLDYRLHFALNHGSLRCPRVVWYHAESLLEQLSLGAGVYLEEHVKVKTERKKDYHASTETTQVTMDLPRLIRANVLPHYADTGLAGAGGGREDDDLLSAEEDALRSTSEDDHHHVHGRAENNAGRGGSLKRKPTGKFFRSNSRALKQPVKHQALLEVLERHLRGKNLELVRELLTRSTAEIEFTQLTYKLRPELDLAAPDLAPPGSRMFPTLTDT